eukprot:SAG22_NODE_2758_length_2239_cov_1.881776_2_plen_76_part_00
MVGTTRHSPQATVDTLMESELEAAVHGVSVGAEGSAVAAIEATTRARVLFDKAIPFRFDAVDRRYAWARILSAIC